MDNRETEKLIVDALNRQKPDKGVLLSAKEVMEKNKSSRTKKALQFYALAACSLISTVIGIIFTILSNHSHNSGNQLLGLGDDDAVPYRLTLGITLIIIGVLLGATAIILKLKNRKK